MEFFYHFKKCFVLSGVAGAGGIIYKPGGQVVTNHAWGLGTLTDNEAEFMLSMLASTWYSPDE